MQVFIKSFMLFFEKKCSIYLFPEQFFVEYIWENFNVSYPISNTTTYYNIRRFLEWDVVSNIYVSAIFFFHLFLGIVYNLENHHMRKNPEYWKNLTWYVVNFVKYICKWLLCYMNRWEQKLYIFTNYHFFCYIYCSNDWAKVFRIGEIS